MVKEVQFTNIKRVLDDLTDHPMLADLTLEQVVRYTIRFIGLQGLSKFYQDKQINVHIKEFKGLLPCDVISVKQVKDLKSGLCLRAMTDNFTPGMEDRPKPCLDHRGFPFGHPHGIHFGEHSFKTQNRVLFTSFPEGLVEVAYKAIPTDEDGFPLVIDNESYLATLEAYIKQERFKIKFDQGKINQNVLNQALQDYAFRAANIQGEFLIPSVSEMESISRALTAMLPRMREFDKGFRQLGNREYLRRH